MQLKGFLKRDTAALHKDVALDLKKFTQKLSKNFSHVELRGKRGQKVIMLLSKAWLIHCHYSRYGRGIPEANTLLFARSHCLTPSVTESMYGIPLAIVVLYEVVRKGLQSGPTLSLSEGPEPIFELLKEQFSDCVSSDIPLADFLATLHYSGEHPFDYWLRLNRAMELTED